MRLRIAMFALLVLVGCKAQPTVVRPTDDLDEQTVRAVTLAGQLFDQVKASGFSLESGPCLSNNLMEDWVFDIVHNPRTKEDDEPKNQCEAYVAGTAHHVVELDTRGNLVRAL